MGFVDYVYPSARHSRFEHSLGVTVLASKMVDAVRRNGNVKDLSDEDRISIRLSALLHDVGHCLFSHTSELVYGSALTGAMNEEFHGKNVEPSPHEFLSYLIVTSAVFSEFFETLKSVYRLNNLNPKDIANRIVGLVEKEKDRFKTCFINGPFDADKLDYFHRDSQFSGIPIQLDIDRLFYEIAISDTSVMDKGMPESIYDLTIGISGVGCIEQIIFNKMLLYSTIYNHHKVQAIDCMFKGIFEYMIQKEILIKINGIKKKIESPVDFLYLVDYDLFSLINEIDDTNLKRLITNIKDRKLLKRALIINHGSIVKEAIQPTEKNDIIAELKSLLKEEDANLIEKVRQKIAELDEKPSNTKEGGLKGLISLLSTKANRSTKDKYLRELAKKIVADAHVDCLLHEVWIDIPKSPSFKETSAVNIRTNKDRDCKEYKHIDDFYPYNPYKELYVTHKLNAHVFAPEPCLKQIAESAKKIFKEELDIEFNERALIHVNG
ncbi:MAG: HD domain-containing protein [Tannerellaceae bacterium]|jgi:HD superfamily phosphohydrolase|nr:HD domain-containing protein [Tannerellaceae bacterium]